MDDFGQTLTGIVDINGRDLRDELMTGWASPSPNPDFLSNMSRQSFFDIGFLVTDATAIPEPSGWLSTMIIGVATVSRRRRMCS